MVLGEPLPVVFEGVKGAGRDDPGLAETAAEELAEAARPPDQGAGPARQEPIGAPSPLEKQTLTVSNPSA